MPTYLAHAFDRAHHKLLSGVESQQPLRHACETELLVADIALRHAVAVMQAVEHSDKAAPIEWKRLSDAQHELFHAIGKNESRRRVLEQRLGPLDLPAVEELVGRVTRTRNDWAHNTVRDPIPGPVAELLDYLSPILRLKVACVLDSVLVPGTVDKRKLTLEVHIGMGAPTRRVEMVAREIEPYRSVPYLLVPREDSRLAVDFRPWVEMLEIGKIGLSHPRTNGDCSYHVDDLHAVRDANPFSAESEPYRRSTELPAEGQATVSLEGHVDKVLSHAGWTVGGQLGSGAFGTVYEARHESKGDEKLALKIFHPSALPPADMRLRQAAIERLGGTSSDPSVVRYLPDLCRPDGSPPHWVAMELVEGEPLDRWITYAHWPDDEREDFVLELVRAVMRLHNQGIVHRDLQPANVIVRKGDHQPCVVDLGMARVLLSLGPQSSHTLAPAGFGRRPFAAPEQRTGDLEATRHPRIDVHALGALACSILARNVADDTETLLDWIDEHRWSGTLRAATSTHPSRRPPDAQVLHGRLTRLRRQTDIDEGIYVDQDLLVLEKHRPPWLEAWALLGGSDLSIPLSGFVLESAANGRDHLENAYLRLSTRCSHSVPVVRTAPIGRHHLLWCVPAIPADSWPLSAVTTARLEALNLLGAGRLVAALLELALDVASESQELSLTLDPSRVAVTPNGDLTVLAPGTPNTTARDSWRAVLICLDKTLSQFIDTTQRVSATIVDAEGVHCRFDASGSRDEARGEPDAGEASPHAGRVWRRDLTQPLKRGWRLVCALEPALTGRTPAIDHEAGVVRNTLRTLLSAVVDGATDYLGKPEEEAAEEHDAMLWDMDAVDDDEQLREHVEDQERRRREHERDEELRYREHEEEQERRRLQFEQDHPGEMYEKEGFKPKEFKGEPFIRRDLPGHREPLPAPQLQFRLSSWESGETAVNEEPAAATVMTFHGMMNQARTSFARERDNPHARSRRFSAFRCLVWTVTGILLGSRKELASRLSPVHATVPWWRELWSTHVEVLRAPPPGHPWKPGELTTFANAVERWLEEVGPHGQRLASQADIQEVEEQLWNAADQLWADLQLVASTSRRGKKERRARLVSSMRNVDRELPRELFPLESSDGEHVVAWPHGLSRTGRDLMVGAPPRIPLRPFSLVFQQPTEEQS